jgi:murein L,D-transpeptidase YcbB/YkuD
MVAVLCAGAMQTPVLPSRATDTAPSVAPTHAFALDLNVPAYRLDAWDGGIRILRFTVAVGMRRYRTPRGEYAITSVDWNPWWIPPDREWARNERPTPPGPSNPMGRVKLNFLPLYFLHGTPAVKSLGQAASHGCVRMANQDAINLALRIHAVGTPSLERAALDSLIADTSFTRLIPLEFPVPIRIRYDVAEVADDTLFLYRDIYSLDKRSELQRAVDALTDAGIDEKLVARDQLRKFRSTSRRPLGSRRCVEFRAPVRSARR